MAVRGYTVDNTQPGVKVVTWSALAQGDTAAPIIGAFYSDRCVQMTGTFSGGASVTLQGTNVPAGDSGYATLTDPLGNSLAFTSAGIKQVLENVFWLKPVLASGDGSTSVVVRLVVSNQMGMSLSVSDVADA